MRVLVIGAAGKTGRAVVDKAVAAGHQVTAFVHNPEGYAVEGVQIRSGDAADRATMDAAVEGQDAVIDTVGGTTPYRRTTLETRVAVAIIAAMDRHRVRRLIVTSTLGVGDSMRNTPPFVRLLVVTFLRGARRDKAEMESKVMASDLDWVITRPAVLSDAPATGEIEVLSAASGRQARGITRSDLATFLVDQVSATDHVGRVVTLTNP